MIIAFGTYDKERHPRVGILIDGLRAHGHEVIELNRPLGLSTAERVRMLKQPWRLPVLGIRLLSRWCALAADALRIARSGQHADAVLVGYMGHFDVFLARVLFRRSKIVLDHLIFAGDTAVDRGSGGMKARLLDALDRRAIGAADIVAVDTDEHLAMLPEPSKGVMVPVGARAEWFDAPAATASERGVSAVFFGLYTPLQGAAVIAAGIAAALDRGAPLRATMIGTGQDWERARTALGEHEAVEWLEWVPAQDLPGVVASHDISFGVFGTSGKAMRVVPNKVYESAASGCAIITSDTAPQRSALGDAALLLPAGDHEAIADALVELCANPDQLGALRAAARARAEAFRAERVVEPLLPLLRGAGS
ncbi:MAG: glycosyltransferase [Microbacterium sp.]